MSHSSYNSRLTEELIRHEPEGQYLERKGRDTKATKIASELIGMLNAGGGVLIYGVADDGVVEDLNQGALLSNTSANLDLYRQLTHDFIKPPANIHLEEFFFSSGELIFLFHVDQDYERLFQRNDNEDVYLRIADANKGPLRREQVNKLEYNKGIRSFEDEARSDFNPEDFDPSLCEIYRKTMNYQGTFEQLCLKRNLAVKSQGQILYKNAALLLFAQDPEHYIPNASVRYVRYQGTELKPGSEFNVIKDQRFEGTIPSLIKEVDSFLQASMRDYYYLDMENGKFMRVPEFPRDAWLEGVVNALCHRSYNIQGKPIMIKHFDDRIEISNSGPLPAQVTVKNIEHERFARNVRIARTLTDLGYVRELNEGVPRIYQVMNEFMLASPEYSDDGITVTLTLRNQVTEHKETILSDVLSQIESHWPKLNESEQRIIQYLFQNNEATVAQISDYAGVGDYAIRYNLKKLITLQIVERQSDKIRDPKAIYRFKSG